MRPLHGLLREGIFRFLWNNEEGIEEKSRAGCYNVARSRLDNRWLWCKPKREEGPDSIEQGDG